MIKAPLIRKPDLAAATTAKAPAPPPRRPAPQLVHAVLNRKEDERGRPGPAGNAASEHNAGAPQSELVVGSSNGPLQLKADAGGSENPRTAPIGLERLGGARLGGAFGYGRAEPEKGQAPASPGAKTVGQAKPDVMTSTTKNPAADKKTPDSRTIVGVSEIVQFSVGGAAANWSATLGTPKTGSKAATFVWTAPESAGSATVQATINATGAKSTKAMKVQLPSGISGEWMVDYKFEPPTAAAVGMKVRMTLAPLSVSFHNSEQLEVEGKATNVKGYFNPPKDKNPLKDKNPPKDLDLSHHPDTNWHQLSVGNTFVDNAGAGGYPKPWKKGSFEWQIPNHIRGQKSGTKGVKFATTTQTITIAEDGTMTVTKAGAFATRTPKPEK